MTTSLQWRFTEENKDRNEKKTSFVGLSNGATIGGEDVAKHTELTDVRVKEMKPLLSPHYITHTLPASEAVDELVASTRREVADIVHHRDDRLLCIVGPCSIHDADAALEYGKKLAVLQEELKNELRIVMRVYFEKPRTTIGWKGLMNDPHLDGSFSINEGIRLCRTILLGLNEIGVPCGVEWLDVISPQYIADLVSWGAIGARTSESQVHRQLVSGLSMPVGFKNATSGNPEIAANACISAAHPHSFLGVNSNGTASIVETLGNQDVHVIHRGGKTGVNYVPEKVKETLSLMQLKNLVGSLIIDCSHGNSGKNYKNQPVVAESVCKQVAAGNFGIIGVMIESNLQEGNQKLVLGHADKLEYGKSITDSCVKFETSAAMLRGLADAQKQRRTLGKN